MAWHRRVQEVESSSTPRVLKPPSAFKMLASVLHERIPALLVLCNVGSVQETGRYAALAASWAKVTHQGTLSDISRGARESTHHPTAWAF